MFCKMSNECVVSTYYVYFFKFIHWCFILCFMLFFWTNLEYFTYLPTSLLFIFKSYKLLHCWAALVIFLNFYYFEEIFKFTMPKKLIN